MKDIFNLENKTVLITGAFGLFGVQIIECFYEYGASLILCGHNQDKIDLWLNNNKGKYNKERFLPLKLELTDFDNINKVVDEASKRFNKIDILVNNAAIDAKFDTNNKDKLDNSSFENYPIDRIRESIEVNLLGTIQITQAVCKKMLFQGFGNIINVGSIYSVISPNKALYSNLEGGPSFKPIDYVVSKSFIPNFTRYIAAHYAGKNIRCNAIAPHGVYDNHENNFVRKFSELSPLKRMCNREELKGPFLFLASEASSYLNGITLILDGGWSVW